MVDNLKHCLNAMAFQVFPNKAYKLQKQVVKLNNYLTEFPTSTDIEARKLEQEELLEFLENRIPTSWKFQMDKEGFNKSSSRLKEFTKTCVYYKECKPKVMETTNTACKSHSKRGGKCKAKWKASKKAYCEWGQDSLQ
eukprot:2856908-Ditylum_brightwellii.AAC.1